MYKPYTRNAQVNKETQLVPILAMVDAELNKTKDETSPGANAHRTTRGFLSIVCPYT